MLKIQLLAIVAALLGGIAWAQEESPDNSPRADEQVHNQRIVDGRPRLYSIKRFAHPLTWFEVALEPAFRSADNGRIHHLMTTSKPRRSVRTGMGGLGSGSGFGPLVTFEHQNVLGRGIEVRVPLVYTYKQYQAYQVKTSIPLGSQGLVDELSLDLGTGYSSRARDNFFGFGNDSPRDEREVRLVSREASVGFTARLDDKWSSSVRGVYRTIGVTKPTTGSPAQDRFDSGSVPGLSGGTLGSAVFSITRDNARRQNYTFSGGSDDFELSFNGSFDGSNFGYWRLHLESQHFFWLTNDGRKALAVRGLVETNQTTGGRTMPFFEMPVLGSSETLRGFDNFRFRDKSAATFSLEYRYRIWTALDWGVFFDAGQVGPQLGDMGLDRFHKGYGFRLFVWAKPDFPISIDVGHSRETWRVYLNFNTNF